MTERNAREKYKINPQVKTAIIYSLDDLFAYSVEIVEGESRYFVTNNGEPASFGNMQQAREAAINEKAVEAYQALSRTYEGPGKDNPNENRTKQYDYMPIPLVMDKVT